MQQNNGGRARNWLFTQNYNVTEFNWEQRRDDIIKMNSNIVNGIEQRVECIIGQLEKGKQTENYHFQYFIAYSKQVTFNTVKSYNPEAHIEMAQDKFAASRYCRKEDTRVPDTQFEYGDKELIHNLLTFHPKRAKKQQKNDNKQQKIQFKEAVRLDVEYLMKSDYFTSASQYNQFQKAQFQYENRNEIAFEKEKSEKPTGIWIYGKPDIGKTHWVRQFYGRLNNHYQNKLYLKDQTQWWGGYQQYMDYVLMDDVDRDTFDKLQPNEFKQWCDKYVFMGQVKGERSVAIKLQAFIITSNYDINTLFPGDDVLCVAIRRRFINIEFNELMRDTPPHSLKEFKEQGDLQCPCLQCNPDTFFKYDQLKSLRQQIREEENKNNRNQMVLEDNDNEDYAQSKDQTILLSQDSNSVVVDNNLKALLQPVNIKLDDKEEEKEEKKEEKKAEHKSQNEKVIQVKVVPAIISVQQQHQAQQYFEKTQVKHQILLQKLKQKPTIGLLQQQQITQQQQKPQQQQKQKKIIMDLEQQIQLDSDDQQVFDLINQLQ